MEEIPLSVEAVFFCQQQKFFRKWIADVPSSPPPQIHLVMSQIYVNIFKFANLLKDIW